MKNCKKNCKISSVRKCILTENNQLSMTVVLQAESAVLLVLKKVLISSPPKA